MQSNLAWLLALLAGGYVFGSLLGRVQKNLWVSRSLEPVNLLQQSGLGSGPAEAPGGAASTVQEAARVTLPAQPVLRTVPLPAPLLANTQQAHAEAAQAEAVAQVALATEPPPAPSPPTTRQAHAEPAQVERAVQSDTVTVSPPPVSPSPAGRTAVASSDDKAMAVARRHAGLYLDKTKAPEFKNVLLVTSANYGYLDMMQNWECASKKLGLDWVVISMDEQMHHHLGDERSILVEGKKIEGAARFGNPDFAILACNKISTVLAIVRKVGLDIVFTDCDNVFKSDPFLPSVTLGSMMRSGDYEYIYGRKSKPPGPKEAEYHKEPDKANTGFYYVAGSRKQKGVLHLFGSGVQWCKDRKTLDDQENFWDSLVQIRRGRIKSPNAFKCFRHCGGKAEAAGSAPDRCAGHEESTVFNYCDMSPWEYIEGSMDGRKAVHESRMVAYHANWVFGKQGKIDKLKATKLWQPDCS